MDKNSILDIGHRVLAYESKALEKISSNLMNNGFFEAVKLIYNCTGHIIVCGMGKSGHIGKKIAASLASTGTPSFFIHPAEAKHGDLGMITEHDIVIIISYSGESEEILSLIPYIAYKKVQTISITGNASSSLAKTTNINISLEIDKEACPYNLAPTVSTSATLGIGDAIAIALMEAKNFTKDDFSKNHPAGNLGKLLLTKINDIMIKNDDIPIVSPNDSLIRAIDVITQKRLGFSVVVDNNLKPVGVFTDGDLRRAFTQFGDISKVMVSEVMTNNPKFITPDTLAVDAVKYLQRNKITSLLIVNETNALVGVTHIHDLINMGFITP